MCGVVGWIAATDAAPSPGALGAMMAAVAHRGPDGRGEHRAESAGTVAALGHHRLAVIDLATGDQPMVGPGGIAVTYNGEIYNHRDLRRKLEASGARFTTESDTEVLLHGYRQWGDRLPERLDGMFAFALWDPADGSALLARDPFGQKPLFLHEEPQRLAFASEVKGLLALGIEPRLDRAGLARFLTYLFVPGPGTLFAGIRQLPPGHAARWRAGALREWAYFQPPDLLVRPREPGPTADPPATFRRLLEESVRRHLVSDVPVGAYLSGGIDSSAIVALMSREMGRPVATFSVGFEEPGYSELPYAREVARRFRCDHREVTFRAADLAELLPRATLFRDGPVAEPADLALLALAAEARRHVTVALAGEGADELLAGYPRDRFESWGVALGRVMPRSLRAWAAGAFARALPYRGRRLRILAEAWGTDDVAERIVRWVGELDALAFARLAPGLDRRLLDPPPAALGALRRILAFEQATWLPDNMLERGDRMSMASALELRLPFLAPDVAVFLAGLPDRWRCGALVGKRILREAMAGVLPESVIRRPKVGFRLPVHEWLRGALRDVVRDHLEGPHSACRTILAAPALDACIGEHMAGRRNHEKLLWALLALEVFLRQHHLSA